MPPKKRVSKTSQAAAAAPAAAGSHPRRGDSSAPAAGSRNAAAAAWLKAAFGVLAHEVVSPPLLPPPPPLLLLLSLLLLLLLSSVNPPPPPPPPAAAPRRCRAANLRITGELEPNYSTSMRLVTICVNFKVSGVPSWHTMLAAVLENLRLNRNLPSVIKTDILAELDKRDAASGTVSVFVLRQELEQSEMRMRKVVEDAVAGLGKNSNAEVVVRDATRGGRYWWCAPGDKDQPSIHRLPDNFVLEKCTVRIAWGLYWQGKEDPMDSSKRFPPYRVLKRHDFFSEASYKRFSGWRACFEHDCVDLLRVRIKPAIICCWKAGVEGFRGPRALKV